MIIINGKIKKKKKKKINHKIKLKKIYICQRLATTQVISCEYGEIFKNGFFKKTTALIHLGQKYY